MTIRDRVNENRRRQERVAEARLFLGGHCTVCNTTENLQFDHIDPSTKLFDVGQKAGVVSKKRFWLEVAKCQLLCRPHHNEKTAGERILNPRSNTKLSEDEVLSIHDLYSLGHSKASIARQFHVSEGNVRKVLSGAGWKHLFPA